MKKEKSYNLFSKYNKFIFAYTFSFIVFATFVYFYFISKNVSFVFATDGSRQHFPALTYLGIYIRDFFYNVFINGDISLQLWDNNLGFGADILTTLNYYSFGDPLDLIVGFVHPEKMESFYNFMVLFRLYLTGIAFSCYCFTHKNKAFYVYIGSLIYVFSGAALFSAIRHPFFINPMLYLPLLLMGVDKILKREKTVFFSIMIAISISSNFYFFYSLSIFLFLYSFLRIFDYYDKDYLKELRSAFFRCFCMYLIGILLSLVSFLPVLLAFLQTARTSSKTYMNLLMYEGTYYKRLFTSIIDGSSPGYYTCLGFCVISIYAVVIYIRKKSKTENTFKYLFLLLSLMLLVPYFGYLMNGFSYISNRYTYLLAFVVAYLTVLGIRELCFLSKRKYSYITMITMIYIICLYMIGTVKTYQFYLSAFFCITTLLALAIINYIRKLQIKKYQYYTVAIITLLIFLEICLRANFMFFYRFGGYGKEFLKTGTVSNLLENEQVELYEKYKDDSYHRVDFKHSGLQYYGLTNNFSAITHYYSLTSKYIADFSTLMDNRQEYTLSTINGFDNRSALTSLASVKYVVTDKKSGMTVPYGFKNIVDKGTYALYENKYTLPYFYSYNKYIPLQKFLTLQSYEREQALLQGIVIDTEKYKPELKEAKVDTSEKICLTQKEIFKSIQKMIDSKKLAGKVLLEDNKIVILEDNVSIPLKISSSKNSEIYLYFKNIHIDTISPYEMYTKYEKEYGKKLSKENIKVLKEKSKTWKNELFVWITGQAGTTRNKKKVKTIFHSYYCGLDNALINLGYYENTPEEAAICFSKRGYYSFEDLCFVSIPKDEFENQVNNLKSAHMKDITMDTNNMSAIVHSDENRIVCISVPYSDGWKAYVDGEEVQVINSNIMFMGVPITEGTHKIELKYCTPGLKLGFLLSMIGVICLVAYGIFYKSKT